MCKTGRKNKVYSAEFKIGVRMDMREHHLSYSETVRKYNLGKQESGTRKGRPPKLEKQVEEDLIAENQRLRMEIEYLKN